MLAFQCKFHWARLVFEQLNRLYNTVLATGNILLILLLVSYVAIILFNLIESLTCAQSKTARELYD